MNFQACLGHTVCFLRVWCFSSENTVNLSISPWCCLKFPLVICANVQVKKATELFKKLKAVKLSQSSGLPVFSIFSKMVATNMSHHCQAKGISSVLIQLQCLSLHIDVWPWDTEWPLAISKMVDIQREIWDLGSLLNKANLIIRLKSVLLSGGRRSPLNTSILKFLGPYGEGRKRKCTETIYGRKDKLWERPEILLWRNRQKLQTRDNL